MIGLQSIPEVPILRQDIVRNIYVARLNVPFIIIGSHERQDHLVCIALVYLGLYISRRREKMRKFIKVLRGWVTKVTHLARCKLTSCSNVAIIPINWCRNAFGNAQLNFSAIEIVRNQKVKAFKRRKLPNCGRVIYGSGLVLCRVSNLGNLGASS